jgi:hypothetical protein
MKAAAAGLLPPAQISWLILKFELCEFVRTDAPGLFIVSTRPSPNLNLWTLSSIVTSCG